MAEVEERGGWRPRCLWMISRSVAKRKGWAWTGICAFRHGRWWCVLGDRYLLREEVEGQLVVEGRAKEAPKYLFRSCWRRQQDSATMAIYWHARGSIHPCHSSVGRVLVRPSGTRRRQNQWHPRKSYHVLPKRSRSAVCSERRVHRRHRGSVGRSRALRASRPASSGLGAADAVVIEDGSPRRENETVAVMWRRSQREYAGERGA